ncbi:unnamed protein product [Rotaria sordida]|uniref:Mannitol dehydrogenase C-terminal domain-containing protein n=1 Tax=Rotaria sordida TaxID=392033 RepID=A0A815E5F0_9BILA|nr:unnamed protein product [Rotaria sordida]CAF1579971.1 unnamed protein product [Rotaria sordida]
MNVEVTPILPPVPGIDLEQYKRTLIERFSNPNIKDTAVRVCRNGASKFSKFVVPIIVEQLKRGNNPHFCALSVGAWIRYLSGFDEQNKPIILQDTLAVDLKLSELAAKTRPDVKEILSTNQIFDDLAEYPQFIEAVERVVQLLYEIGSKETLKRWVNEAPYQNITN